GAWRVVGDAEGVWGGRGGGWLPVVVRRAKFRLRRSVGSHSLRFGRHRDLSVQGRHDPDARGVLHRGRRSLSRRSDLMSHRATALRAISAAMLAACMVAPAIAVDGEASVGLGVSKIGVPPEDFDFGITGQGQPGQWSVVRDVTAIHGVAIEQSDTDPTENRFPLAIYQPLSLQNLASSIRLKLISGTMQTAGLAFRFVNADNYYVISASALEERVDLFRVFGGKMERIGGAEADVALNQ